MIRTLSNHVHLDYERQVEMNHNHFHVNLRRVLMTSGIVALLSFMLYSIALLFTLNDIKSAVLIALVVGGVYGLLAIALAFVWPGNFFHRRQG